tara:strand:+ start:397 stop:639 length:243 start_codon:yes stop_codon:yes gene_type:complete
VINLNPDDFPSPKEFDDKLNATRIKEIVIDIIDLTDSLNTRKDLDSAWSQLTKAVQYLSSKDSMVKIKEELRPKEKEGGE